jgi:hypothetical protein
MQTDLADVDEIISPILETLEQALIENFCECLHSIDEEHIGNKCFGLDYNGTIWSDCKCRKPKLIEFRIEFKIEDDSDELH